MMGWKRAEIRCTLGMELGLSAVVVADIEVNNLGEGAGRLAEQEVGVMLKVF